MSQWSEFTNIGNILLFIPESECNVLKSMSIGDTGDPIFAPAICSRPRVLMREVYGANWG